MTPQQRVAVYQAEHPTVNIDGIPMTPGEAATYNTTHQKSAQATSTATGTLLDNAKQSYAKGLNAQGVAIDANGMPLDAAHPWAGNQKLIQNVLGQTQNTGHSLGLDPSAVTQQLNDYYKQQFPTGPGIDQGGNTLGQAKAYYNSMGAHATTMDTITHSFGSNVANQIRQWAAGGKK